VQCAVVSLENLEVPCDAQLSAESTDTDSSDDTAQTDRTSSADAGTGYGGCGDGSVDDGEECDGQEGCTEGCRWGVEPDPPDASPPDPPPLVHRYSFDGEGVAVLDSVGHAHGRVVNGQLDGEGQLSLQRIRGAYVELPSGLLSGHTSATLECWLTWQGLLASRYERIFDFGNRRGDSGADGTIETTFYLSPSYGTDLHTRIYFRDSAGDETRVTSEGRLPAGRGMHVAVVLDSERETISLYLDGRPAASETWRSRLSDLRDENAWLGRSQYADDPYLSGVFDEFRIYRAALSPEAIERSFELGPDRLVPVD
jgi:hypothetical protein